MRSLRHRIAFVAPIVIAFAAVGVVSGRVPQQVPPTFRAEVEAIAVDAFVTDRAGNVVADLTRDDFELTEDGKPQAITSFSLVDIPIGTPGPILLDRPDADVATNRGPEGRIYAIAVDEIRPDDALRARAFLSRFLNEHFTPDDVGLVVNIGRGRAVDAQDFTSNRRLLLAAVNQFQGWPPEVGGFAPRSQANGLRTLVESLARIEGRRKALIYVTNAIHTDVFDILDYRGGVRSLEFDDLRAALTSAMRGGVVIYAIDPALLTAGGTLGESESAGPPIDGGAELERISRLRALSESTGGFGLVNSNSINEVFTRVVRENSTYYVLGYTSTNVKRDGRYRRLQVQARRPGLTVRTRHGYIGPSKSASAPVSGPRAGVTLSAGVAASIANPIANHTVPMSVFAAAYRGPGKDAQVVIAAEIDATHLAREERDASVQGDGELAVVAISAEGKLAGTQRERFSLRLTPDRWRSVRSSGIRVVTGLTLPPGRYQLRVAGGGVNAEQAGNVLYDLAVPDFRKAPLAMSGLLLSSRQAESALVISSTTARVTVPAPATATRTFASGDVLSVYAEIYDSKPKERHRLDLLAQLRDRDGRVVGHVVADRREDYAPTQKFEAAIPLAVPTGEYVLHVEARSTHAMQPAVSRDIPLRVQ